jgi:hypothetical protein
MAHTVHVVCEATGFDASVTVSANARVRVLFAAAGITDPIGQLTYEPVHYRPTGAESLSIVHAVTAVPEGETVFILREGRCRPGNQ